MKTNYIENVSEDVAAYVLYSDGEYLYTDKDFQNKAKEKEVCEAFNKNLIVIHNGVQYTPLNIERLTPAGFIPYQNVSLIIDNEMKVVRSTNLGKDQYAVTSVNGKIGDVVLVPSDINPDLVVDANYVHTDNNFTNQYKENVDNIQETIESNVLDSLVSTSTTKSLSANMGKELDSKIQHEHQYKRYLSDWNCATGLPVTAPPSGRQSYESGDFYEISVIAESGQNNYMPDGTEYVEGHASTVIEEHEVAIGYRYIYDGYVWTLRDEKGKEVSVKQLVGDPKTNPELGAALNEAWNAEGKGEHQAVSEEWTFKLDDGTIVTKKVLIESE